MMPVEDEVLVTVEVHVGAEGIERFPERRLGSREAERPLDGREPDDDVGRTAAPRREKQGQGHAPNARPRIPREPAHRATTTSRRRSRRSPRATRPP